MKIRTPSLHADAGHHSALRKKQAHLKAADSKMGKPSAHAGDAEGFFMKKGNNLFTLIGGLSGTIQLKSLVKKANIECRSKLETLTNIN